ncbi:Fur family transcriptional regulator [Demequina globuliformis]|uniref:Fur family transcriptional regulator n=1 Tax=Demequina globuliformis TaxID=676202 RepID=UPI0007867B13|nr:Fur family transcriptional regulator [Demequina globuliformis]
MSTSPAPRMTKQRAAIMDVLSKSEEFRSAQAWHDTLRHDGSSVGLATVYRSLQSLAEAGQVDAVVTDSGETLYRRCGAEDTHHHHLRCRSCGAAHDIEVPEFERWAEQLGVKLGFTGIDHTVEITGICRDCAAQGR